MSGSRRRRERADHAERPPHPLSERAVRRHDRAHGAEHVPAAPGTHRVWPRVSDVDLYRVWCATPVAHPAAEPYGYIQIQQVD
jgi:hypothetical protein